MLDRSLLVAIMRSLFISIVVGLVGEGNDDIFILNTVLAISDIVDILNPILLLTTSATYV